MEKLSADMNLAVFKKDGLRRALEQFQEQTNGVLMIGLLWKDLEEHFDSMARTVSDSLQHLMVREIELEERLKEVGIREKEAAIREEKLNVFERRREEKLKEVAMKEEELAVMERRLEECQNEQRENEDSMMIVKRSLNECVQELKVRANELNSVRYSVEEEGRKLVVKRHLLDDLQKQQEACSMKFVEESTKLTSVEELLRSRVTELEFKKNDMELLEMDIDGRCKELDSIIKDIDLKNVELLSLQSSLKSRCRELDRKKEEIHEIQNLVDGYKEELDLKGRELASIRLLIDEQMELLASKEREHDAIKCSIKASSEEADSKKRELDSLCKTIKLVGNRIAEIELREGAVVEKEKKLNFQLQQLESQKEVSFFQNSLQDPISPIELGEEGMIIHPQVKVERLDSPTTHYAGTVNEPLNLMFFVCEHIERLDSVQGQLLHKIQMSLDPAMLVLVALQEFHRSKKDVHRFGSGIMERSCILVLGYLSEVSPMVTPQVRDAAIILASEWKSQLRTDSPSYYVEVLALLRFIAVYGLTPNFSGNELELLVNSLSGQAESNQMRVLLGLSGGEGCSTNGDHVHECMENLVETDPSIKDGSVPQHTSKRNRPA
ncbi:hypothetical protein SAY87_003425 [Trapa incisa]|uniref:FRIGIDA-like protein n=1 Tax=Trapa incisa TaxID=236973 RepID=A0AAN7KNP5_9MYRT|nr:hypothetical protein SAY87_003425 [Trapa incisa]